MGARGAVVSDRSLMLVGPLEGMDRRQTVAFVRSQIGVLLAYDRAHGTDLSRVLEIGLDAPNRDEALQLMEFLVSPAAQGIYAELNNEYPVLPGAPVSDLVASWGTLQADRIDLTEVASHRGAALRIMEEVNFDG